MGKPLKIAYAGSLRYYRPRRQNVFLRWLKQWVWTYKVRNVDFSTRSGYYLFRGLRKLKEKYGITASGIRVEMWGMIDSGNRKQAKKLGISDIVTIEGYYSKADTIEKLEKCDVVFLPLESGFKDRKPLFIPGKLYEYLKLGKPVLALSGEADCTEILKKSGLGIIADPHDDDDVAEKIKWLMDHKKELPNLHHPNSDYINKFSFEKITGQLVTVFDELSKS